MARGAGGKGKREGGGPDWLNPAGGDGGGAYAEQQQPEKPRRKRRGDPDDDDLDAPVKTGIQWKPLFFLIMMTLPAAAPLVINVLDRLQTMGIPLPGQALFDPNPYRPCLKEFYADWAPEKLGNLDKTLDEYKGRERQLFGKLSKKYGKPANFAKCVPKKTSAS